MQEARPFYPALLPLYIALTALPVLGLLFLQSMIFPSLARGLEWVCMRRYLPLVLVVGVTYMAWATILHVWHVRRLSLAVQPPSGLAFRGQLKHVVVVLNYKEPLSVLRRTIATIASQAHLGEGVRPTVVLACEARDPGAKASFRALQTEFAESVEELILTQHTLLPGELPGKSSNENWAVRELYRKLVDDQRFDPFSIMITICDADSLFSPLYLAQVEASFWQQRDGRRLIYSSPLNTYRNLSSAGPLIQLYEMLRSSNDAFFSLVTTIASGPGKNRPRRAQVNNYCSMTTVPIGAYIINDLVEDFSDRYVQAKRHRWGITEIAWVFGMYKHMPFQAWVHLLTMEIRAGTFTEEAGVLVRFIFHAWLLTSMWLERHDRVYGPGLMVIAAMFVCVWVLFWLGELSLWKYVLNQFPIEKPSPCAWLFLVAASPFLSPLTEIIFHIVPTLDCLIHVTFFGELVYINAPKGTEQERANIQQQDLGAASCQVPSDEPPGDVEGPA